MPGDVVAKSRELWFGLFFLFFLSSAEDGAHGLAHAKQTFNNGATYPA